MLYNVRDFGASGDGTTSDQDAIQKTLDHAAAAGGGCVYFSAGVYRSGTLMLRSNLRIHLEAGAVLLASNDVERYPGLDSRRDVSRPLQALLFADGVKDLTITGPGIIDGGGGEQPPSWEEARGLALRPLVALFRNCHGLRISGVTLRRSQSWTLHLRRCEDVQIDGVVIRNNWPNSDGIDPDGCRNVTISNCDIEAGDDCIVLKSTQGDTCEGITINNCVLRTNCAALKLGTESLGVIRNVVMTGCVTGGLKGHPQAGVCFGLYMKDGGLFENVLCSNTIMESGSQFPILIDITPRFADEPDAPGRIRQVRLSNLMIHSPGRIHVEGTPGHAVEQVAISGIQWHVTGSQDPDQRKPNGAARIRLAEDAPNHAGTRHLISAAHVLGLSVRDISMSFADGCRPDRELLHTAEVSGLSVDGRS